MGALAALCIPVLAKIWGWEMAFIIIGALGFCVDGFLERCFSPPLQDSRFFNKAELSYIRQVEEGEAPVRSVENNLLTPYPSGVCFTFQADMGLRGRQSHDRRRVVVFSSGGSRLFLRSVWICLVSPMGQALIFVLYFIVTVIWIFRRLSPATVCREAWHESLCGPHESHADICFHTHHSPLCPAARNGIALVARCDHRFAGAAHQAWSANLYSTIGDMFPTSTVGTIVGIGTMAGGVSSYIINQGSGILCLTTLPRMGDAFRFSFTGKPAGYMIVFSICAVSYLLAWCVIKLLVPRCKKIEV